MLKNKVDFNERKLRINRFVKNIIFYKDRIINSLQFDYRTLTFVLIKNINYKNDLSFSNKKLTPLYLIKLLN